jgi:protease I
VQPDFAVYETNPDFFDCIIIVGGPGSPMLAENKEVTDLLMISHKKEKTIGAICLGPVVLARAGILSDKSSTVFPDRNAIITLRNAGAIYRAQPVVVDGNIVTADGPESAGKFGTEIVGLLKR